MENQDKRSAAAERAARYQYIRSRHRCIKCGAKLPDGYEATRCKACCQKDKERYQNEYAQKLRTQRQERIAAGLCASCGKVPAPQGFKTCQKCRDKHNANLRKHRQKG